MSLDLGRERTAPDAVRPQVFRDPGGPHTVDLASLVTALRRRWILVLCLLAAGAFAGAAFSLAFPPLHTATTTVLVRHPSGSDPTRAMVTDVQLAQSRTVARRAVRQIGSRLPTESLVFQVRSLSDSLMEITAVGPTGSVAVRRADAVAASFLAFRREEVAGQAEATGQALQGQLRVLSERTAGLSATIDKLSAEQGSGQGTDRTQTLRDLLAQRAALDSQISSLRDRVANTSVEADSIGQSSRVIDPASEDHRSQARALVANVAAGIVGGGAVGAGWVVLGEVVLGRAWRREDIMAALGVPVRTSIGRVRRWRPRLRAELRRSPGRPSPDLAPLVSHLVRCLPERSETAALLVVSVGADAAVAAGVLHVAARLSRGGHKVVVTDLTANRSLRRLLDTDAASRLASIELDPPSVPLRVCFPAQDDRQGGGSDGEHGRSVLQGDDVVLTAATLNPATGAWHLSGWAKEAVVVVGAGRSTSSGLRSAVRMLVAAGIEVLPAVVVGADPDDETVGLPDPWLSEDGKT